MIVVKEDTHSDLIALKVYPRETMDDVIKRLIDKEPDTIIPLKTPELPRGLLQTQNEN